MVFIKPFLGAAAIFSIAFAAPSPRFVKRGSEEKSPSNYESSKDYESSKNYDSSKNYESSKNYDSSKNYESSKDYKGSYEDKSYNNKGYNEEEKEYYTTSAEKSHRTTTAKSHEYTTSPEYEYTKEYEYTTSTKEYEYTTTSEYETSSAEETSTVEETSTAEVTTTTSAYESSPTYGSGSSNWDSEGYDDCVSKCLATYGNKDTWYKPSATQESEGSVGTGATHTVVVAPTQGVLRYIPFAVNASIGDTIKFMWGANNHTVTKGSGLLPCNKTGDSLFTSGSKNKDFVFTQVVNTTDPTYFFCNTPGHCQKGMFGIINPPVEAGAPTSASFMLPDLEAKSPDLKAYAAVVDKNTVNNAAARSWGGNIAIGQLPDWAHELAAENIMYTRSVLAANPDLITEDGSVSLGAIDKNPMMIPNDVAVELANAASTPATTGAIGSAPPAASSEAAAPVESQGSQNNSAGALGSSRVLVAAMVVVATFLAL